MDAFEQAFSEFLKNGKYEQMASELADFSYAAFKAGWVAAILMCADYDWTQFPPEKTDTV